MATDNELRENVLLDRIIKISNIFLEDSGHLTSKGGISFHGAHSFKVDYNKSKNKFEKIELYFTPDSFKTFSIYKNLLPFLENDSGEWEVLNNKVTILGTKDRQINVFSPFEIENIYTQINEKLKFESKAFESYIEFTKKFQNLSTYHPFLIQLMKSRYVRNMNETEVTKKLKKYLGKSEIKEINFKEYFEEYRKILCRNNREKRECSVAPYNNKIMVYTGIKDLTNPEENPTLEGILNWWEFPELYSQEKVITAEEATELFIKARDLARKQIDKKIEPLSDGRVIVTGIHLNEFNAEELEKVYDAALNAVKYMPNPSISSNTKDIRTICQALATIKGYCK